MNIQTVTSRSFNQDPTAAKCAALSSPVQITERGRVSHVLLSIEKYEEITGSSLSIVALLGMPGGSESELDIPKSDLSSLKDVDLD